MFVSMKLSCAVDPPSEDPAIATVNRSFETSHILAVLVIAAVAVLAIAAGGWARDVLAEQRRTRADVARLRDEQTAWASRVVDRLDRVELTPVRAGIFWAWPIERAPAELGGPVCEASQVDGRGSP